MKTQITVLTAFVTALLSFDAAACGDSLYRVGKGVSYRTYSAPLPGNLLIYDNSSGARPLADELARSGHTVHVVDSEEALLAALRDGDYDIVIAPFSERTAAESAANTSFLPVAASREEEALAKQSYRTVMVPDRHEIKHYLKAIHESLKSRG